MKRVLAIIFPIVMAAGLATRMYLAVTLPVWYDEAYWIWIASHSVSDIMSGTLSSAHPPGYFLLIKTVLFFSDHAFVIRLLTVVLAAVNMRLLYLVFGRLSTNKPRIGIIAAAAYAASGYFIVFDWQAAMYTGLTTVILVSYMTALRALKHPGNMSYLAVLIGVTALGLYYDYGFLWYYLPLTAIAAYGAAIRKSPAWTRISLALLAGACAAGLLFPAAFRTYRDGISGISWVGSYVHPAFFVPFFLGSHMNVLLTVVFAAVAGYGAYRMYRAHGTHRYAILFCLLGCISGYVTYLYSVAVSPLFHVRSLQVLGLGVLFATAVALEQALEKRATALLVLAFFLISVANVAGVARTIADTPGRFLVSFTWNPLRMRMTKNAPSHIWIERPIEQKNPIFLWGIRYVLDGKDSFGKQRIPYTVLGSDDMAPDCPDMIIGEVRMHICR